VERGGIGELAGTIEVRVDGVAVRVAAGGSLLDACDRAGVYVPRLCAHPGLPGRAWSGPGGDGCGLCLVRLGDGSLALACATAVAPGLEVSTNDAELSALRLERLAPTLAGHPHVCLTCPSRDGCTRDECSYGNPPDARCCDEFGHCELGRVVAFVDLKQELRRFAVAVSRETVVEGRIHFEPGLCIACGRCVVACDTLPGAGHALEMAPGLRPVAQPKLGTLRESGCTFCGQCVLVCPAGALRAPGEKGARWLAKRRERSGLAAPVLAPDRFRVTVGRRALALVPRAAGVFQILDAEGRVLRIGGEADLRQGLVRALEEPACGSGTFFQIELDPLYTQRESELLARYAQAHEGLPPGNDLGDEMFACELLADDLCAEDLAADDPS
jgi:ferredoxin